MTEQPSVSLDQDLCMGSGYCIRADSRLFGLTSDGIAELQSGDPPGPAGEGPVLIASDQLDDARALANICPSGAITVHPA